MRKRIPEELKDSRIEWIGQIPKNWSVYKLGYYTYLKGRVGWHGLTTEEYQKSGPFLVTGTDFSNGKVSWDSCHHISFERYEQDKYIQLKEGDLLITKDGTIGKTAIVKDLNGRATLNTGVFLVRPINESYITRFLYWILNSSVFDEYIEYSKTGSTIAHLYQETFSNWKFPVPMLSQQKAIATFLDQKTQIIDQLIENKLLLIEKLKEKRQALITQAVTKGLNPDAPMKDSGIERLGEIPAYWDTHKLKYFFELQRGHDLPKDEFVKGEFPVYGSNGKIGYHNEFTTIGPGVTVGRSGSVGEVNFIESNFWAHNTSLYIVRTFQNNIRYIYYLLLALDLKSYSEGSAVGTLNRNNLHPLYISVPESIEEQDQIVSFLDQSMKTFDNINEKILSQLEKLKEYRQSLISAAVTGKIDVRDEFPELAE